MECARLLPCLLAILALVAVPLAAAVTLTPHEEAVNNAIAKGVAYLKTVQAADGSFESPYRVGVTAGFVLALVHGGVPASDPSNVKAVNFLLSRVQADGSIWWSASEKVYETSLAMMALDAVGVQPATIAGAADYLLKAQWDEKWGIAPGDWRYGGFAYYDPNARPDLSNTHFALLALRAAEHSGWSLPTGDPYATKSPYVKAIEFVTGRQTAAGGFTYVPGWGESGSMTTAGILSLRLCNVGSSDPRVEKGVNWLGSHYSYVSNPGDDPLSAYYYYLWTAAKALILTDVVTLPGVSHLDPSAGPHPGNPPPVGWYYDFSEELVNSQDANGDWPSIWGFDHIIEDIFALLVLERVTVVNYRLTVKVVDDFGTPLSGAAVTVDGRAGTTDGGQVIFTLEAGSYLVSASKPTYTSASTTVSLTQDMTVTLVLHKPVSVGGLILRSKEHDLSGVWAPIFCLAVLAGALCALAKRRYG